jgi:hypothetical protein
MKTTPLLLALLFAATGWHNPAPGQEQTPAPDADRPAPDRTRQTTPERPPEPPPATQRPRDETGERLRIDNAVSFPVDI